VHELNEAVWAVQHLVNQTTFVSTGLDSVPLSAVSSHCLHRIALKYAGKSMCPYQDSNPLFEYRDGLRCTIFELLFTSQNQQMCVLKLISLFCTVGHGVTQSVMCSSTAASARICDRALATHLIVTRELSKHRTRNGAHMVF
jgi:hypothetical protein